ncbi:hypothetical protein WJX75_005976 [Coccomyxa subellipsoidea]|uniref:Uncharacterized protein n=1 Tax=Coccomyxa subellipsoidea TaxID=248742 RepID=A0ABR2Z4V1_9CHLO
MECQPDSGRCVAVPAWPPAAVHPALSETPSKQQSRRLLQSPSPKATSGASPSPDTITGTSPSPTNSNTSPSTTSSDGAGLVTSVSGGSATAATAASGGTPGEVTPLGTVVLGSAQSGIVSTNLGSQSGSGGTLGGLLATSSIYVGSKVSAADLSAFLATQSGLSGSAGASGSIRSTVAQGPPYGQAGSFPGR